MRLPLFRWIPTPGLRWPWGKVDGQRGCQAGEIAPEHVAVEFVYGEARDGRLSNITVVAIPCEGETEPGTYYFAGEVSLPQGALGYTLRVRPESRDFPYTELPLVTWAPGL